MINKTRSGHVTPLSPVETPFSGLSPERVLDAASSAGLDPDGRLFALNSYENRVYQLGGAEGLLVLKFYRPGRWSDAQILEEHRFTAELAAAELPVAAPVAISGQTLLRHREFRFAAFPYLRGSAPELDAPRGPGAARPLARPAASGGCAPALRAAPGHRHRAPRRRGPGPGPAGGPAARGAERALRDYQWNAPRANRARLPGGGPRRQPAPARRLPPGKPSLERARTDIRRSGRLRHGAARPGPLDAAFRAARRPAGAMGGAPRRATSSSPTSISASCRLIEPLRGLRMLHHAAWVCHRWLDPAFPRAFPWFGEARYWEGYVGDLREQLAAIDEPPLLRPVGGTSRNIHPTACATAPRSRYCHRSVAASREFLRIAKPSNVRLALGRPRGRRGPSGRLWLFRRLAAAPAARARPKAHVPTAAPMRPGREGDGRAWSRPSGPAVPRRPSSSRFSLRRPARRSATGRRDDYAARSRRRRGSGQCRLVFGGADGLRDRRVTVRRSAAISPRRCARRSSVKVRPGQEGLFTADGRGGLGQPAGDSEFALHHRRIGLPSEWYPATNGS